MHVQQPNVMNIRFTEVREGSWGLVDKIKLEAVIVSRRLLGLASTHIN